jgi:PAS domain S-box-containing protein
VEVAGPPVAIDRAVEVPWVLLFCDADDAIRSVEGMVEEVYGCTAEEIIGRTVLSLVHPDDAERCVGVAVRLLTHPTVDQFVTHRINRFDGSVGVVQSVLHRGDDYRGNLRVSQYDAERQLHNDLLDALREEQFKVVYQPVVELNGARVIGAEALVRWQHPNRGLVPPLEFIPYAETSGLIVDIGRWVLRTACREAATWPTQIRVAVNLSVRQLADENIAATVAKALLTAGLDPRRLELEITESALIEQPEQAIRSLNNLKSLGLTLAIDDFGTGYSSLAYLKRMPIDTLKIDRSFVEGLGKDDGDEAIVSSVLGLARAFRLHVVAEGVETDEQRHHLSNLGCQLAQGYLWSRPVPPDEFRSFIALPQQPTTDPVGQPGHLKQPESHAAADGVSSHIIPAAQPPHADQRCPTCGR